MLTNQKTFSPGEVAAVLGIPVKTVMAAIRRGDLEAARYNQRVIVIDRDALARFRQKVMERTDAWRKKPTRLGIN